DSYNRAITRSRHVIPGVWGGNHTGANGCRDVATAHRPVSRSKFAVLNEYSPIVKFIESAREIPRAPGVGTWIDPGFDGPGAPGRPGSQIDKAAYSIQTKRLSGFAG